MTTGFDVLHRPAPAADDGGPSPHRRAGLAMALGGLALVAVSFVATVVAGFLKSGGDQADVVRAEETLAWSFGLNTLGLAVVTAAVAALLIGIVYRVWMRADRAKDAIARLRLSGEPVVEVGEVRTPWGKATQEPGAPAPLPFHTLARRGWAPLLLAGAGVVAAGFVLSLVWAGQESDGLPVTAIAWTQGLQFLGVGLLLAGVALLLAAILGGLREGGGEVQESVGATVRTLHTPAAARIAAVFVLLGLVVAVGQLALHVVAAQVTSPQTFEAWLAWLGPTRDVGLGLLLAGIALGLVAIGDVLAFQYDRIRQIVATGS